jgi:molybdate transport system substrate-binding protein
VAAAANLVDVFQKVGGAFKERTGIEVTFSYGSTAQLTHQIENGAPFDLFASADTEHVDALVKAGKIVPDSRAIYAQGQLALWIPGGEQAGIQGLADLGAKRIRFIALAQPELAPYGRAAREALQGSKLWERLQPKIVYGTSISMAKQMASSGNADAAFTAYSLVLRERGSILKIDPSLHNPIEQALGIVAYSAHKNEAIRFHDFMLGAKAQAILAGNGYLAPGSQP